MMLLNPFLLGLLWSIIGTCYGLTEVNKKETNQVYSYTYHFQHNGTTDPKQFIERFLADTPSHGSIVHTFSNNNFRGFVSKGFLPAGPIDFGPSYANIDDIKNVVDKNFRELEKPLSPVEKFPNIDLKVNNFLGKVNEFPDRIPDRIPQHQNPNSRRQEGVVTRVREFKKEIPNGKIYEKIETYSFNHPPNANVITHTQRSDGGHRHHQEVNHQTSRGFGQRTISYFTQNLDHPVNNRNVPNNFNANIIPTNNQQAFRQQNNFQFGSRFIKPNDNNGRQRRLPVVTIPPFNNNNNNHNMRRDRFRDSKDVPDVAKKVDNIIKTVNNRLNDNRLNNRFVNNGGFQWDDNNRDWAKVVNSNQDWKRLNKNINTWNQLDGHRPFTNNGRPFRPDVEVNSLNPQSVDAIRSTLEALVGAKLDIPSFPLDQGHRNLGGGGGLERIFHIDRIIEGPNLFSRNQHRGYERKFQTNTDNGFQRSNQWSTNTVRRLDAQSSRDDFRKDFIDVFNEDHRK